MKYRLYSLLLSAAVLLLPGCVLFRDNRPLPSGSPYGDGSEPAGQPGSEAEVVNAAVSAVSLKMAVSSQGPFRIIPRERKITSLGLKTIESLTRMGLSRIQAPCPLYLEDSRNSENEWTVILFDSSNRIFYRKTFFLKGKKYGGP